MHRRGVRSIDCHQHVGSTADAQGVIIEGAVQGTDIAAGEPTRGWR